MTYDPQRHHRRSIRLHGYDYALSGAYFVTVVAQNRACLFGTIQDGAMLPSPAGDMLQTIWQSLPARFPHVALDAFAVMPNHVHGVILLIDTNVGAPLVGALPQLGALPVDAPRTDASTTGNGSGVAGEPIGDRLSTNRVPTRGTPTDTIADVGAPLVGAPLVGALPHADTLPMDVHRTDPVKDESAAPTLGDVVGAWKSLTTVAFIAGVKQAGWPPFAGRLWQRNYYEHIVRDDEELARIRHYILTNSQHWVQDAENPQQV